MVLNLLNTENIVFDVYKCGPKLRFDQTRALFDDGKSLWLHCLRDSPQQVGRYTCTWYFGKTRKSEIALEKEGRKERKGTERVVAYEASTVYATAPPAY